MATAGISSCTRDDSLSQPQRFVPAPVMPCARTRDASRSQPQRFAPAPAMPCARTRDDLLSQPQRFAPAPAMPCARRQILKTATTDRDYDSVGLIAHFPTTRERCSGRRRELSGSADSPLHADGSIGSVRGLHRPQTTIDASSVVDLSAPMCSRPSHEQFFLSRVSLLRAADVAGNRISRIRTAPPPGGGDGPGGGAARFAMMSSVETAATGFNDSVGRSVALLAIVR
ncbi:hypothetical protein THAOC_05775 [Thalassiosira oceanica]|uniref:Uncharacterized protein n=1 Tax=Thalassiosira oceanica TaxID=159749 RepID=K0T4W1_THAOC|nr:hypothetical protein THAOC_05775 [Thalassiosira oceanica]|eukprot:EJK72670.1 hypothetical protein THAOC_05775 [Thalassiosira oceanica]